jgi:hypothetical protein
MDIEGTEYLGQETIETLGVLSADTIINGEIVEIKAVAGTRATLGTEFKKGYRQGAYLAKQCPAPGNPGTGWRRRLFEAVAHRRLLEFANQRFEG